MAIRLMVLGQDEGDAKPWVVVLCPEDKSKRVERFFEQKFAKSVCCPGGTEQHNFEVLVLPQPPKTKASGMLPDIYGSSALPDSEHEKSTSCGTLLRLAVEEDIRYATLGGIIKVVTTPGSYNLYGLTAGHILNPTKDPVGDGSSYTSSDDDGDTASDEVGYVNASGDAAVGDEGIPDMSGNLAWPDVPSRYAQDPQHINTWSKVGTLWSGSGPLQDCNLDWTLIENVERLFLRPNILCRRTNNSQHENGELRNMIGKSRDMQSPQHVVMNRESHDHELRQGVLSNLPTMLVLSPGQKFVQVYPLSMKDGSGIFCGDSGCWVVNDSTLEVYGHVAAGDVFGDAYIVPLLDTFDDIRRQLNAIHVSVATSVDILCHTSETMERDDKACESFPSEISPAAGKTGMSPMLAVDPVSMNLQHPRFPPPRPRVQSRTYENMIKGASSPLTSNNLRLLNKYPLQDPNTQDFNVNNILRMEQIHTFNQQLRMKHLGLHDDSDDHQKWLKPPSSFQSSTFISDRYHHGDPQPSSCDKALLSGQNNNDLLPFSPYKPSSSDQKDKGQLDGLKLYAQQCRSSNDHPTMRFLSPGAPADPTVSAKQTPSDLKTPYADGSSAEDRRLIAKFNSEQSIRRRERRP